MRPFNLSQAKSGKPVCTRDGHKVRIVCFDVKNDEYPIVALVDKIDREDIEWYTADGTWYSNGEENKYYLMMASEHHEGWVNIYPGSVVTHTTDGNIFNSREAAILNKEKDCIATTKIEWEG